MKKSIIFIFVLLLLASCSSYTYHNIPENEKPLFVNNDTIYYLNNINHQIDSFHVTIYNGYQHSDYSSEEYIQINYLIINKKTSFERCFTMQGPGWASIYMKPDKYSNISDYYIRSFNNNDRNHEDADSIINNMNINGIIYPIVYQLVDSAKPDSIPNTVYYTFNHGIIRYDYADGRKYEIMNESVAQ